jgi:hypothetical protein
MRRALYDDGAPRPYTDADLLVAPPDLPRAGLVLERLGFELRRDDRELVGIFEPHHQQWSRRGGTERIELHWRLAGIGADPLHVWSALSAGTEPIEVGGVTGESLDQPRIALVVALHAAQHGRTRGTPLADLERALDRFPEKAWSESLSLALELQALEAFTAGLRLAERGRELAVAMGVPESSSAWQRLVSARHPAGSTRLLEILDATVTPRDRLRMLLESAFQKPERLRGKSALARRGSLGLVLAYPEHWLIAIRGLPAAIRAVTKARRPPG